MQDEPTDTLRIRYDPLLDEAVAISLSEIKKCMGRNRLGCRGTVVAQMGYDDGVWLYDSLRTFNDAILYWSGMEQAEDYLYAEYPGSLGVIPYFARPDATTDSRLPGTPFCGRVYLYLKCFLCVHISRRCHRQNIHVLEAFFYPLPIASLIQCRSFWA